MSGRSWVQSPVWSSSFQNLIEQSDVLIHANMAQDLHQMMVSYPSGTLSFLHSFPHSLYILHSDTFHRSLIEQEWSLFKNPWGVRMLLSDLLTQQEIRGSFIPSQAYQLSYSI